MSFASSTLSILVLCAALAITAPLHAQEDPAGPPEDPAMGADPLGDPANGGINPQEVSFMDFATVDVAALAAKLPSTDEETISNLRRFANFEALNNSRGARDKALAILAVLDGGALPSVAPAPAVPGVPGATPVAAPAGAPAVPVVAPVVPIAAPAVPQAPGVVLVAPTIPAAPAASAIRGGAGSSSHTR